MQVYDAGFRLPYYGVEQDWLGIEFDHSHRRNKSALLPERLHVRRALNDLPTQGRLFGVVAIDTGREARSASEREQDSGEYLKIQVTRDRLVANKAYIVLRDAVRWSLDYYATRERLREESSLDIKRPEEASTDKVGRIRDLVAQVRYDHASDDNVIALEREVVDLSQNIEDERRADEAARTLLGPLASAGMAALALEHESRKEMRLARSLVRRLRSLAKDTGDERIGAIADQVASWVERLESTRKVFAPMLDADDRDQVEALSLSSVMQQIVENVAPLGGVATTDEQKAICYVLEALRAQGDEWLRREAPKAARAVSTAKGRYDSLEGGELSTLLMHGSHVGQFDDTKVIFLPPPAKEDAAVAALWCRWDYEKPLAKCGFYFGLWSPQPQFPKPADGVQAGQHVAFIGYRFETPEEDDNHNYYHAQPCRSMGRKDDEIEIALPVSNRMPTWPVAADGAVDLLLCLVTAIYGMKGLRELRDSLNEDARARQSQPLTGAFSRVLALTRPKPAQLAAIN